MFVAPGTRENQNYNLEKKKKKKDKKRILLLHPGLSLSCFAPIPQ